MSNKEFYVTLPSNVASDLIFNNKIGNYKTRLSDRILLEGDWEVGLSEISFTNSWYNVQEDNEIFFRTKVGMTTVPDRLPPGRYEKAEHIISALNNLCSKHYEAFKPETENDVTTLKIFKLNSAPQFRIGPFSQYVYYLPGRTDYKIDNTYKRIVGGTPDGFRYYAQRIKRDAAAFTIMSRKYPDTKTTYVTDEDWDEIYENIKFEEQYGGARTGGVSIGTVNATPGTEDEPRQDPVDPHSKNRDEEMEDMIPSKGQNTGGTEAGPDIDTGSGGTRVDPSTNTDAGTATADPGQNAASGGTGADAGQNAGSGGRRVNPGQGSQAASAAAAAAGRASKPAKPTRVVSQPASNIIEVNEFVYPTLSREIAMMLGFRQDPQLERRRRRQKMNHISISPYNSPKGLEYTDYDFRVRAHEVPDVDAGYHSLYLYTDIVKPTYVGDAKVQLLRVVNVPDGARFGSQIVQTYNRPHYYPLSTKHFDTIEIDVKNELGETVLFKFGRTIVTLHFRETN